MTAEEKKAFQKWAETRILAKESCIVNKGQACYYAAGDMVCQMCWMEQREDGAE